MDQQKKRKLLTITTAFLLLIPEGARAQQVNASPNQRIQNLIIVGANIQVSKAFGASPHGEIYLAADPRDAKHLLGGSMVRSVEKNTSIVIAYASFDGGKSWTPTLVLDDDYYHSDPAAGFGLDGSAYFLEVVNTRAPVVRRYTYIHRSKDGGKTWLPPVIIPMIDRNFISIDDTGSKYHGSIYLNGVTERLPVNKCVGVSSFHSIDGGATFECTTLDTKTPDYRPAGIAPSAVLSDGTLVISYAEAKVGMDGADWYGSPTKPNGRLKVVTSQDGGKTFSEPAVISEVSFGHSRTSNANFYSLAADRRRGPFKDRLYVAWPTTYSGGSDIMLSYSSDNAKTWSSPVTINDDRKPINPTDWRVHFSPVVAVNPDGVVGVMWYDRRDSANNLDWSIRFRASLDGGETFLPSVKVSEADNIINKDKDKRAELVAVGEGRGYSPSISSGPIKLQLHWSQFYLQGGHTAGMAADADGAFHPFWVDNRTGISQIWTAEITVEGKAISHGNSDLAQLDDITDLVMIACTKPHYDPLSGIVSVDAQIRNTSTETISGPIRGRVTSLKSGEGGVVAVLAADNSEPGIGAVWDFTQSLSDNKLKPGEKSKVKHLEFRVSDLPSLDQVIRVNPRDALNLVDLEIRVFGKRATSTRKSEQ